MLRAVLCTFLLFVACGTAFAHPHVFVDATVVASFDKDGFVGLKNHWVFDEIYSVAMVTSVDDDKNEVISAAESDLLKQMILDPLARQNYYNYVALNANFLRTNGVRNFKASFVNRRLVLDFVVTFAVPVANDYTMLVAVISDVSNYIQISADMENADVEAPDDLDVEFFNDGLQGLTLFKSFRSEVEGLYFRFKRK